MFSLCILHATKRRAEEARIIKTQALEAVIAVLCSSASCSVLSRDGCDNQSNEQEVLEHDCL
jgi:hypothetical protein